MSFNTIAFLDEGCPLEGLVQGGDELLRINGHPIHDVLDYKFYAYDEFLTLEFRDAGEIQVEKDEGEDLGLNFEDYLMDNANHCANKCVFCFIDQLPKGLRSSLYFKDDDARLSFLTGNYITCTNLSERELSRICDLRVSPLNISVHATDGELRARMLRNRRGAEIMDILRRFAEAGIEMECQVVVCPGWNDGQQLQKTMEDLASFYPAVNSVSIVPVGLTCHRQGLTELSPFDKESALATVRQVESYAALCREKLGTLLFYCSDELYLKAELPLPAEEDYEGYPQLENGVGLLRLLEEEFRYALSQGKEQPEKPFSIATGVAAAPFMEKLCALAGAEAHVYAIKNDFLGHTVDVAGLLTGRDLLAQLRGKELGAFLLIPLVMLRHGEGVFLDDMTIDELSESLGVPVCPVDNDGDELLSAMLGRM